MVSHQFSRPESAQHLYKTKPLIAIILSSIHQTKRKNPTEMRAFIILTSLLSVAVTVTAAPLKVKVAGVEFKVDGPGPVTCSNNNFVSIYYLALSFLCPLLTVALGKRTDWS